MFKHVSITLAASLFFATAAFSADLEIPRSMADKGRYFLLKKAQKDGVTTTIHKRIGVNETGYSKTEINCKTRQYRDMGYNENGPEKIIDMPGRWTDLISGSSKSDLVAFVCSLK